MGIEFTVALISLSGVLISALVSLVVSKKRIQSELDKLRLEMHHGFADRLHAERLSSYPAAYFEVETYVKSIQQKILDFDGFCSHFQILDSWHSNKGYLLSSASNRVFYSYLRRARRIADRKAEAFHDRISDDEKRRELIRRSWELELALKNDLGVFRVEFYDPEMKFESYKEIDKHFERTED